MAHTSDCAVYNPTPGLCDCEAGLKYSRTAAFHDLWTQAAKQDGYIKRDWTSVQAQLRCMGLIHA